MNWEVIGSTGEWAGAIAVVFTLFYLAKQVKDATAIARSTSRHAIAQMNIDAWAVSVDPQILSSASAKAISGEELSPEEQGNYERWILMRMRFIENALYQFHEGLLDPDEWSGYRNLIPFLVGPHSPAHEKWKEAAVAFSTKFVEEVEEALQTDQGQSTALV